MSVAQMIRYVAAYYPNWNHKLEKSYLAEFELPPSARVGTLSPGERQKLSVLLAIGFEPELLILDEPAAAMDHIARRKFFDLLLTATIQVAVATRPFSFLLPDAEKVRRRTVFVLGSSIGFLGPLIYLAQVQRTLGWASLWNLAAASAAIAFFLMVVGLGYILVPKFGRTDSAAFFLFLFFLPALDSAHRQLPGAMTIDHNSAFRTAKFFAQTPCLPVSHSAVSWLQEVERSEWQSVHRIFILWH